MGRLLNFYYMSFIDSIINKVTSVSRLSVPRSFKMGVGVGVLALFMASCSESDGSWDPYANWQSRNAAWYEQVSDSARTAIAEAKAKYGDAWEEHCEWRRYKSLYKDANYDTKKSTDSICVHIIKSGSRVGDVQMPYITDSVRVNYRGYLMPAQYEDVNGALYEDMLVFDQSYYGELNTATAAPSLMPVGSTVEGFATALQNMVPGDDWYVYIPQEMAYGSSASGSIPAYSTLKFRLNLVALYRAGSGVPGWK